MATRKDMDSSWAFGIALKQFRAKRKMTQEALAHEAGISLTSLARLETGAHGVRLETILRTASALEVAGWELVKACEDVLKKSTR